MCLSSLQIQNTVNFSELEDSTQGVEGEGCLEQKLGFAELSRTTDGRFRSSSSSLERTTEQQIPLVELTTIKTIRWLVGRYLGSYTKCLQG